MFTDQKTQHSKDVSSSQIDIYKSNTIPTKIPARYFGDMGKLTLKFIQKGTRPRRAETIL